jgi:hypothetical protein
VHGNLPLEWKEIGMKTTTFRYLAGLISFTAVLTIAGISQAGEPSEVLRQLARQAVSENSEEAANAIAQLRSAGQAGLDAMFVVYPRHEPRSPELQARLTAALDSIGSQRNCQTARLFWHTDLEAAKSEARATGKPILSLRLLGKLTDEYSCANSRFFRTALYANEEVSRVLRERFVLHWKSVRPVPKVTIDFGDGRKLERTLTGNSIHYVLDCEGRPIDALPGLYGPAAFLRELGRGEWVALASAKADHTQRDLMLRDYHQQRNIDLLAAWQDDLTRIGVEIPPEAHVVTANAPPQQGQAPPAKAAMRLAIGKGRVEAPILQVVDANHADRLQAVTSDDQWERMAELHLADARLDAASVELMRVQLAPAINAGKRARTKAKVEDPLLRVVANFQRSIAVDTMRNEYLFHRQIHQWLAEAKSLPPVDELNERVYAQLFLTPSSDPWLGLVPDATYTALQNDGRTAGK